MNYGWATCCLALWQHGPSEIQGSDSIHKPHLQKPEGLYDSTDAYIFNNPLSLWNYISSFGRRCVAATWRKSIRPLPWVKTSPEWSENWHWPLHEERKSTRIYRCFPLLPVLTRHITATENQRMSHLVDEVQLSVWPTEIWWRQTIKLHIHVDHHSSLQELKTRP